jgi:outer membrane translocation and assembly module TamA
MFPDRLRCVGPRNDLLVGAAADLGVSVRWRSTIGPSRGDVAYGERESRVRVHFSIRKTFQ